jgi:D-alanine transaminase
MTELAYVNGVFGPIGEATVSIEDRGFVFGDGIYEVVAAYNGRPFLLPEHLARLQRSADAIGLDLSRIPRPLEPVILEGLRRSGPGDTLVYIQITRGVAPRSHTIPEGVTPTVVMTFRPLHGVPEEMRRRGLRVITTVDKRWSSCYVKAITLLPNILAKQEALRRGCDDAIFITPTGEVRECTAANLFIVHGGAITIPPRTESILHGVTQGFLLTCAGALGLNVREQVCDLEALRTADEVIMSGTTVEVLAVTSIDDQPVGTGSVGPITRRLYDELQSRIRRFATGQAMTRR